MEYDCLRLENQLCFDLYSCSKGIVSKYKPYLDRIGLTYTQYITMMVIWEEHEGISVGRIGEMLRLDSGTLTPLLKKLEQKHLIVRSRSPDDERVTVITPTPEGMALRDEASKIPGQMASCIDISPEDALLLKEILGRVMASLDPRRCRIPADPVFISMYY